MPSLLGRKINRCRPTGVDRPGPDSEFTPPNRHDRMPRNRHSHLITGTNMTTPGLVLTDRPTDADDRTIGGGLADYNAWKTGYRDWRPLAALLQDPGTGETLGGMIGRTSYGLLFIDLVHLPETTRGQDIGSRLLRMMEQEGARRGCKSGFLYTMTIQAPGFYERHGWAEFGRIPCDPPGNARIFMTKSLLQPVEA
jgi:GNAT superfamily N-acetyltransferase